MDVWPHHGLEDDLRPRMAALLESGQPFVLVTLFAADGGPRGLGAQMVVTETESWGFLSGGCIEAEVALQGRKALADGEPRHLVYGVGSPWVDTPLPCGGRLDLLAERIGPNDPAIAGLVAAYRDRQAVRYRSDGRTRECLAAAEPGAAGAPARSAFTVDQLFTPVQKLVVIGNDPIALAIAAMGARLGWCSHIVAKGGPAEPPGLGVTHHRGDAVAAMRAIAPDASTAVAVATHDAHDDQRAIVAALATRAGYIGVLGARRRIPERLARLRKAGLSETDLARLHMPIGLPIAAATPWEIAVSVTAQIIAERAERAKRAAA